MTLTHCLSLTLGFAAFVWTFFAAGPAAAQTATRVPSANGSTAPELLTGIPEGKVRLRPALDPYVIRRRFVHVSADLLKRLPELATVNLALFDDRHVNARLLRVQTRAGGFTWFGYVEGEEIGDVILTVVDGVMMGTVHLGAESIHLRALDSRQTFEVRQIDPASLGPDHDPSEETGRTGDVGDLRAAQEPPPPVDGRWARQVRRDFLRLRTAVKALYVGPLQIKRITDSGHRIDIMVAYTREAASKAKILLDWDGQPHPTVTDIHTAIQHAMDKLNNVVAYSGIPTYFNLVHKVEVKEPEPNIDEAAMVTNMGNGNFAGLVDLADQYRADITSLFLAGSEGFDACGKAERLLEVVDPVDQVYEDGRGRHWKKGKHAVKLSCAVLGFSLPHEVGHNVGLLHDAYVSSATPAVDGGRGFVLVPVRKRTIMAYDDLCVDFFPDEIPQTLPKEVCPRLPRFSTPYGTHYGWPLGTTDAAFTDLVDASSAFEQALWTVANFRSSIYQP
jgi:hypothetical protein